MAFPQPMSPAETQEIYDAAAEEVLKKGRQMLPETWSRYVILDDCAKSLIKLHYWPSMAEPNFSNVENERLRTLLPLFANKYRECADFLQQHEARDLRSLAQQANALRDQVSTEILQISLFWLAAKANRTAKELEVLPHQQRPKDWAGVRLDPYEAYLGLTWLQQKLVNFQAKTGVHSIHLDGHSPPPPSMEPNPVTDDPIPDPVQWQEKKDRLQIQSYARDRFSLLGHHGQSQHSASSSNSSSVINIFNRSAGARRSLQVARMRARRAQDEERKARKLRTELTQEPFSGNGHDYKSYTTGEDDKSIYKFHPKYDGPPNGPDEDGSSSSKHSSSVHNSHHEEVTDAFHSLHLS